jgi:hypothetical protein
MLAIGFIMLRYIPTIQSYLKAFIMKWCWILSKAFSASIEMIKWFLSLLLLNVLYYVYRFEYVEPPLHPWDEAYLVVVNDLSDVLLDSFSHYFIEDFCINVHEGDWPIVLLFGGVFVQFGECNDGFIA